MCLYTTQASPAIRLPTTPQHRQFQSSEQDCRMTPTTSTEDLVNTQAFPVIRSRLTHPIPQLPGSIVLKSITIDQQGRKWDLVFRPAEGVHPNTLSSFVANSSGAIPELSLGSWLGSGSNGTVWEVSVPAEKHLLFAAKFSHVPSKGVTEERQSRAAQRLAKEASTYSDLHQLRPECVPKIARYFGLWTAVVPANWAFIPWIRPEFRSSTGPLTVALIILEKLGKSITRSDLFISESQAASEDISVYESRWVDLFSCSNSR